MGHVRRRDSSTSPSPREALELEKLRAEVRNLERQGTWVSRLVSFVPLASVGIAAFAIWDGTTRWQTEKQLEREAAKQAHVQREQEREQQLEDAAAQRFREAFARISSASEAERLGALAYMMSRTGSEEGLRPLTKEQARDVVLLLARSIAIEPSAAVRRAEISAITQLMHFSRDPDVARQAIDALIESNRGLYEEHAMYRTGRIVMDTTRFHDGPIEPSGPHARAMSAGYAMVDIMRLSPRFRPTPKATFSREGHDHLKLCGNFPVYDFSRIYCPTCDFKGINAPCSLFIDTALQRADFRRNDLRASNFARAEINEAWFIEADLRDSDFGTDTESDRRMQLGGNFSPLLTDVMERSDASILHDFGWKGPSFRCADLRGADFGGVALLPLVSDEFQKAHGQFYAIPPDFVGSNLEGATLEHVHANYFIMADEPLIDGGHDAIVARISIGNDAEYVEDFETGVGKNPTIYSQALFQYAIEFDNSHWPQAHLPPWLSQHLKNGTYRFGRIGGGCDRRDLQNDYRERLPSALTDILKRFDSKYIIARPDPPFIQSLRQSTVSPAGESLAR